MNLKHERDYYFSNAHDGFCTLLFWIILVPAKLVWGVICFPFWLVDRIDTYVRGLR